MFNFVCLSETFLNSEVLFGDDNLQILDCSIARVLFLIHALIK